ncbi:MAG: nucleotidyltransferase family protein [Bacteroidales bacterium]|nr:nucleotidyltransferase family protein [Bacteroidales bacterium]
MVNIWAIVLAAGTSTRMKQQKLLLPFGEKTIIESVLQNIIPVLNKNVLIVLGSHYYEIMEQIRKLPVATCFNKDYQEGMLSSVICGFRNLPMEAEAAIIFLGDQPQIPPAVIQQLIKAWRKTGKGIIIPVFNGKRGHPVLIETKFRPGIEQLDPEEGLRQLMVKFDSEVAEIECKHDEILKDIDTPRDYLEERLKSDL